MSHSHSVEYIAFPTHYAFFCKRPATETKINPSNIDALLAFMKSDPAVLPEHRFGKDQIFLSANEARFPRKGRNEALKIVYGEFAKRYHHRHESPERAAVKEFNPLVALQAAPGGGKSFFLDELCKLEEKDLSSLCEDEATREMLRNSVVLCVTFNSSTGYISTLDECEFEVGRLDFGLAARMLWSYFISTQETSWPLFVKRLCSQLTRPPNMEEAYQCIRQHCQRPILLCVDELLRASRLHDPDSPVVRTILTAIGQLLSNDTEFNAIVSTLDASPVRREHTSSGRRIAWVPLPALHLLDAISLFKDVLSSQDLSSQGRRCIKLCISDCNGHPRSLERLAVTLNNSRGLALAGDYVSIMNILAKEMSNLYPLLEIQYVKLALQGKPCPLAMEVPIQEGRECPTVASLVSQGVFINALEEADEARVIVPRLSPLLLRRYALSLAANDQPIAKCLTFMLATESNFSGLTYEQFHAWWEVLRRHLLPSSTSSSSSSSSQPAGLMTTLSKWYGLATSSEYGTDPAFIVRPKAGVLLLDDVFPPSSADVMASGHLLSFDALTNNVLLPKAGNKGFDMVIFEQKANCEGYIAINIECKFSAAESKTTLEKAAIWDKHTLMMRQYANLMKGKGPAVLKQLSLGKTDLYLVIIAFRKIPKNYPEIDRREGHHLITLGRKILQALYTPTLSSRPQFLASLEGNQEQGEEEDMKAMNQKGKKEKKQEEEKEEKKQKGMGTKRKGKQNRKKGQSVKRAKVEKEEAEEEEEEEVQVSSYDKNKLKGMKRAELQKLCKRHGLRANATNQEMIDGLVKLCQ